MWTLSGFADEIAEDFETQLELITELGMHFIEFRSAWGVNVLDLSNEQLDRVELLLAERNLRVSSIGSPIGKIFIDEPFAPHLVRAKRAIEIAKRFDAPFIRIFSFFLREGTDPASVREEVLLRMREITALAEAAGVVLLHENEKDIYGDTPERCLDVLSTIESHALRATWDSSNFVQVCGLKPFDLGWQLLRPYLVYMQIKDCVAATGEVVTAGRGDGQLPETIAALAADGFDGFFSLEPHLGRQHALGGFSGPQLWASAHEDFTALLKAQSIAFD
jgi:sugar phosphate isomerase/epimerase